MRVTVIHNPTAGSGGLSATALRSILAEAGYHVRYQSTRGAWKSALQLPADFVVAAGGDGTVRKVATQLAETTGREIPFAVLPLGTANNFATSLGIRGDPKEIVKGWKRSQLRLLDLGAALRDGESRLFLESAGGGVLAEGIARGRRVTGAARKGPRSDRELGLKVLARVLEEATPEHWEVELDGADRSGSYIAVEALNIPFVGTNVRLAKAVPGDGYLDFALVRDADREGLLRYVARRLDGVDGQPPVISAYRFQRARIRPARDQAFHIDDKSRPWAKRKQATIELLVKPGAVSLLGA